MSKPKATVFQSKLPKIISKEIETKHCNYWVGWKIMSLTNLNWWRQNDNIAWWKSPNNKSRDCWKLNSTAHAHIKCLDIGILHILVEINLVRCFEVCYLLPKPHQNHQFLGCITNGEAMNPGLKKINMLKTELCRKRDIMFH